LEPLTLGLITQIPEVMILTNREEGYFLILKENIQVPEYLRDIYSAGAIVAAKYGLMAVAFVSLGLGEDNYKQ